MAPREKDQKNESAASTDETALTGPSTFNFGKTMADHDIIVIGSSSGGIKALSEIASSLPSGLPASVFVVQHLLAERESMLDEIISDAGPLEAVFAAREQELARGRIYLAPPNRHLLVKKTKAVTTIGPRVNRMRPSIDVLFRSAAVSHSTRVVAVLLTGQLDDGVSGLSAVKGCGGLTIVQDPADAEFSELPKQAADKMAPDHILPLEKMAEKILELSAQPAGAPPAIPEQMVREVELYDQSVPHLEYMEKMGQKTPFTCPECGGVLWRVENDPVHRYICHTGHSFTRQSYLDGQSEIIEFSLWSAVRHLEERAKLLRNMAENQREKGNSEFADDYLKKAEELSYHAGTIRDYIVSGKLTVQ